MNQLLNPNGRFEIFNYQNLGKVRTYIDNQGNPWFCLYDVCKTLGLNANDINKVSKRIDTPYQNSILVGVQTGIRRDGTPAIQNVPMTFITEAGLYQAIGRSRKPEAQVFMNWVFGEVLPMIRRTGMYLDDDTLNKLKSNPTIIGNMIVNYENEINSLRNENQELQSRLEAYDSYTREKDGQINELWDKLAEYDDIDEYYDD